MASDDDILKLYTTIPKANVVASPQPLDPYEQELLRLYATPAPAAPAPPARTGTGLEYSDADSTGAALAKNVATGAIKGAADAPGFVGNIKNFANYAADRTIAAVTGQPVEAVQQRQAEIQAQADKNPSFLRRMNNLISPGNVLPSGDDISAPVLARTGAYEPDSTAGRMLQSGTRAAFGGFAPGAVGGGNMLVNGVRAAPVMAGSGAVGQYAGDATGDPLIGAGAAMLVPGAVSAAKGAGRASLGTVDPETAALAHSAMNKYGIPLGPGDLSSSVATRFLTSVTNSLPLSGGAGKVAQTQEAFNRAVGSTFGAAENKLTAPVMARARDEIGSKFDTVAQQTRIIPDQPLARDFATIVRDAQLGPAGAEARVRANMAEIGDRIQRNGGVIDGKTYQDLTRVGSGNKGAGVVQKLINDQDPYIRDAGMQMRTAIDDALERHAPPDMVNLLRQARGEWKNMRTVEDLVPKGSPGDISPALLQGRVNMKNKGTYGAAYGGGGDLGELAAIGQRFMKAPPSSGTAERSALFAGGAALTNMLVNPSMANIGYSIGAPAAGLALGRGANALLHNEALGRGIVDRSLGVSNPAVGNKLLNLPVPAPQDSILTERKRKSIRTGG